MVGDPWLSIVGMADDNATGLPPASRAALDAAEIIFGGSRHLSLIGAGARGVPWPVPFSIEPVLAARGQRVAVLASGDPFWFGAGGSLATRLTPEQWRVYPAPSTFSRVAGALGWRLEGITCHGLHTAPVSSLRRALAPHARMICLMRDAGSPRELATWLCAQGAGASRLWVCEKMGGEAERIRETQAEGFDLADIKTPVAVAVAVEVPPDIGLSRASGLPDDLFFHDGQITKRPVRALTLSALAPRLGELLWDIGAGSGSVSVEWCLAGGHAVAFEQNAARVDNISRNIEEFGLVDHMKVVAGKAEEMIADQPFPDAVFVGGGGRAALFEMLLGRLPSGTRLVANGVTLETESLLAGLHAEKGGNLLRIELAEADRLGSMYGWQPARPVVQWSVTL